MEDVLHFFKDRAQSYITDLPHGRLPRLDSFLPALEDNDIDGAILLTQVDTDTLKRDLGVASAGVRGVVLRCIQKLRQESIRYATDQSSQALQLPTPTAIQSSPATEAPQQVASPVELSAERTCPGEVQIQDAHGKKRRKLNLTQLVLVQKELLNPEQIFTAAKTIATANQGYFGDSAFLVDDLFYGNTKEGQEIGELHPDGEVMVLPEHLQNDAADQNYEFTLQNKSVGEAHYVYKQMRHFMINGEIVDTERNGRAASAFAPYREGLASSRSATVVQFRPGNNEPVAIKENFEHLGTGHTPNNYAQQNPGEWDFLVQKHDSSDDQVLPVYGESDDEESETIETTEGDLGEDAAEEEVDEHILSEDRVAEIIKDAVNEYIAKWQESLEKQKEKKAWTVWNQMKRSRSIRELLIRSAQAKIEHLTSRLGKIKKEIGSSGHRNEKAVQEACASFEFTVVDREEWKWKIEVWKRKQEPYHIVRHGAKNTNTGLPTPLTSAKADRRIQIHPDDRLSVEPGAVDHMDVDVDTRDEIHYEADVETDQEMHYEDEAEEYHTPHLSPEPDDADAAFLASTDEMELDPEGVSPKANQQIDSETKSDSETIPNEPLIDAEDKHSDIAPEDEESDFLESPSNMVPHFKSTPGPRSQLPVSSSVIDLTGMTTSDSSAVERKTKGTSQAARYQSRPEEATAAAVDSWEMQELKVNKDRERMLIKMLRNIGQTKRQRLHDCYQTLQPGFSNHLLVACQFVKESGTAGVEVLDSEVEPIHLAASICILWMFPMRTAEEIRTTTDEAFNDTLDNKQLGLFTQMFRKYLLRRDSSLFRTPQTTPSKSKPSHPKSTPSKLISSDLIEISSDSQAPSAKRIPHTKRKRAVKISENALNNRAKAHRREQKFTESQTANSSQLAAMPSGDSSSSLIEINPARDGGYDAIYVHDRIARRMKPHQIDGVRFLWREITADDDDGAQGCVLAHTMGLGKTMQTITVLVAVNEAARSKEKPVRKQLPRHLKPRNIHDRMLRILILCPPSLIENWSREIHEWAPKRLGYIYSLDSGSRVSNMNQLEEWMRTGGVVLVGYEKFSMMVLQKVRNNQKTFLPEQELARLKQMLLEGPEIAVADEAHRLKDRSTDNSKAAAQIETLSRIALTGTPMSNNVEEIYALISWAAPNYLGNPVEFKAHYAEPIAASTDVDSTAYEKRKGLMRLKVLHTEIQPKVNRADIEVLKGSLKPKVEFIITVPLGEIQTELYKRYVNALLNGDLRSKASEVRMFGWLSDLQLLTNHPQCFRSKLLAPPKARASKKSIQDEDPEEGPSRNRTPMTADSGSATPLSENMSTTTDQVVGGEGIAEAFSEQTPQQLGLDQAMILEILKGFEADLDPQLSAKMAIFLPLLRYSLECGDKAILFSSSIPTLDYLAELLTQQDLAFGRIDGRKNMKQKMQALENFHFDDFDIMLVSTKAGGVGLNIQGANRVFIFDFSFNPMWEEQAIGRAYRIGQTKPVYVYRFVAGGTFETNLYNKQLFKSSLTKRVIDKKNPQRIATRNTKDYLYEPRVVKQLKLDEEKGKDPGVLDRLFSQHGIDEDGKIDTMIRGIKTWETLQVEELDEPLNEEEQREVNMEIEQGLMRTKGKRALGAAPYPLSSTAPAPMRLSGLVKLPISSQPVPHDHPSASAFVRPPPPATFAGPSAYPQAPSHPLGGLPSPRKQQPYHQE